MIDGRRILALIIARGGSKGLPDKNLLDLGGRPLVAWSVLAARRSRLVDRIVLSSEDERIIAAAQAVGCEAPFRRPVALATDDSSPADVIIHALDALDEKFDAVALLQATSPLRRGEDIDGCITAWAAAGAPACVSVTAVAKPPDWLFWLDDRQRMRPVLGSYDVARPRQTLAQAYVLNGAVFLADTDWFRRQRSFYSPDTVAYVMPPERSVDIDTAADLEQARRLSASDDSPTAPGVTP
jgi:CMP-N,N'-diacetyllegionaminic acid synthase